MWCRGCRGLRVSTDAQGRVGRSGKVGNSDCWGAGAGQLTEAPAWFSTAPRDAPPMGNCAGPNGPSAKSSSWQTCGFTVGLVGVVVAALAVAAGTGVARGGT